MHTNASDVGSAALDITDVDADTDAQVLRGQSIADRFCRE